jgi:large subunit ribosomal protein L13
VEQRDVKQKTITPNPGSRTEAWWLVDAEGQTLGRMASGIAQVLRGKHRPEFSPHIEHGDHVVVVNATKVHVTGAKLQQKYYYRHSGYPGGLREDRLDDLLRKDPERVIRLAVRGMLPRNRLARHQLRNLKVYPGAEHPHQAQSPVTLALGTSAGGEPTS